MARRLYSTTGTLAASTDSLDASAVFGEFIGVEVLIVNTHVSLPMDFVDTAGVTHVIPPNQSLVLPSDFRSGSLTGTGTYYFFAATEPGMVARVIVNPTIGSGVVTVAMFTSDVPGRGLDVVGLNLELEFAADSGLEFTGATAADTVQVNVDDATIKRTAATGDLAIKDAAFTAARLKANAAAGGLVATDAFDPSDADQLDGWKANGINATAAAKIIAAAAIVTAHIADGGVTGVKRAIESKNVLQPAADRVTSAAGATAAAFATTYQIAANRLVVGSVIRIRAAGKVIDGSNGATLQVSPRLGTVVIGTKPTALDVANDDTFIIDAEVVVATAGAVGFWSGWAKIYQGHEGSGTAESSYGLVIGGSIDTTIANDVDVLVDWGAGANDTIDLAVLTVEVIG